MTTIKQYPNLFNRYPAICKSAICFGTIGIYWDTRTAKVRAVTQEVIIQLGKLLLASKYFCSRKSFRLASLSIIFIMKTYKKMQPSNIKITQSLFSGILIWFVKFCDRGNGIFFAKL